MGIYGDYLAQNMSFADLTAERKKQLKRIAKLRGDRDILVYASDIVKGAHSPVSIDITDIIPFKDQLSNLKGKDIDIILETPGGIAEVVEDIIKLIRSRYDHVGVIIPGMAKSAGTIFSMAADEIMMGETSALGPIDAQILNNSKKFSADAFLEGLDKIKQEVMKTGKLNPAYIPILQNISPGEIQHCENAQNFSKKLVTQWLSTYKFKYWDTHKSTGQVVSNPEKEKRAQEIAEKLCRHSDWLTHSRSIQIPELTDMGLLITDYSKVSELNDAINRYHAVLRITFDTTNIYKIIETTETQIQRFAIQGNVPIPAPKQNPLSIFADFACPKCNTKHKIQVKLDFKAVLEPGIVPFPKDNKFICPTCQNNINLAPLRLQIEAQTGKKIID